MKYSFVVLFICLTVNNLHSQTITDIKSQRYEISQKKQAMVEKFIAYQRDETSAQELFDVKYYKLELSVVPTMKVLSGKVTATLEISEQTLDQLDFNLLDNMTIQKITLVKPTSAALQFTHTDDMIHIKLDRTYNHGEQIVVAIQYLGLPAHSFGIDTYDGKPMIWSLSEPFGARAWWPCKDVPSDKADSVDIFITAPEDLIVASNGSLRRKQTDKGYTKWWWHEGYPIVTYLVSVAIHPYIMQYDEYLYNSKQDTMPIEFYMFEPNASRLQEMNLTVKQMIAAYADMFGEYPFVKEKYGHADFLGGGAMEHQTCTSFSFWSEEVYAHELAHQWWGDLITCNSFHHIWLNEGFATYSEALWYEYKGGAGGASHYQMTNSLYLGSGTVYVEDPEHDVIFDGGLSYNKGSWVLHMLRHIVGDDVFFRILKTYYASPLHAYGTATTEDFMAICEQVSGMDLSTFFHQWIYEDGFPEFRFFWTKAQLPDGSYQVEGVVKQVQKIGPAFELPLDMTIRTRGGDTTTVMYLDEASEHFLFTVPDEPLDVVPDMDNWILKTLDRIDQPVFNFISVRVDDDSAREITRMEAGGTYQFIITLVNNGLEATDVELRLSTNDGSITFTQDTAVFDQISMDEQVDNSSQPFMITVAQGVPGHMVKFYLTVRDQTGENTLTTFSIPLGTPDMLFVDDDAGMNYDTYISRLLTANDFMFDVWNTTEQGFPGNLSTYRVVIWATGDDRENSLQPSEQQLIAEFLEHGGRLLLTGQNIGYDLVGDGSANDRAFYENVLHAEYVKDNAGETWLSGIDGDVIGDNIFIYIDGHNNAAGNQDSPDVISPFDGSTLFLTYLLSGEGGAIRYINKVSDARIIYLPFGLEAIANPTQYDPNTLFVHMMSWLNSVETGVAGEHVALPADYVLEPNYPNPFNPRTVIQFSVPKAGLVTLTIFTIQGQQVATLMNNWLEPGHFQAVWNGALPDEIPAPSGVYLYRLQAPGFSQTRTMVLMK